LRASNKIFRSALIAVTGLFICFQFICRIDHEFIFDFIILFAVATGAAIIFMWTISKDRKEYSRSKKLVDFAPTFIGSAILLGLLTTIFILNQRDNSRSKLYCVTKQNDFNGVSIDFREDGTYKMTSWSLGADYYRGTYTMKDSIITLDKSKIENAIVSNRLVVRPEIEIYEKDSFPGKDTVYQKSIYQIDENGKVISGATDFVVR